MHSEWLRWACSFVGASARRQAPRERATGRGVRRYQNKSNVFELMDEIRDKLRLLNYEELFCRHVAAPIHT